MINFAQFNAVILNLATALVILGIGTIVAQLIDQISKRLFHEIEVNQAIALLGLEFDLERLIRYCIVTALYIAAIVLFLRQLGIESYVLFAIFSAMLLLLLLSVLVFAKDFVPNLIGRAIILQKAHLQQGSFVSTKHIDGNIEKIGLLSTIIRSPEGDLFHVPNQLLASWKFWLK